MANIYFPEGAMDSLKGAELDCKFTYVMTQLVDFKYMNVSA